MSFTVLNFQSLNKTYPSIYLNHLFFNRILQFSGYGHKHNFLNVFLGIDFLSGNINYVALKIILYTYLFLSHKKWIFSYIAIVSISVLNSFINPMILLVC